MYCNIRWRSLAKGVEQLHDVNEYHGDLHTDNVMVQRAGLEFDLKVLDFFHLAAPRPENIQWDVCDMIQILHECLGGAKAYARQPEFIKELCCGLKHTLILKKYRNAGQLRKYIERMSW